MLSVLLVSLVSTLTIAGPTPAPVLPLPDALELCIHKAEICALESRLPKCLPFPDDEGTDCIENYEDCSYDFPEAHEQSCRMTYVWCKLEEDATWEPKYHAACAVAYKECPTL